MRRVRAAAKSSSQQPKTLPRTPLRGLFAGRTLCPNRNGELNLGRGQKVHTVLLANPSEASVSPGVIGRARVVLEQQEQQSPTELSPMLEVLYSCPVHHGSHQPNVATEHLKCG